MNQSPCQTIIQKAWAPTNDIMYWKEYIKKFVRPFLEHEDAISNLAHTEHQKDRPKQNSKRSHENERTQWQCKQ